MCLYALPFLNTIFQYCLKSMNEPVHPFLLGNYIPLVFTLAICSVGFPSPVYFCVMSPSSVLNIIWISLLHCFQSSMVPLCVSHHLVRGGFQQHPVLAVASVSLVPVPQNFVQMLLYLSTVILGWVAQFYSNPT
jgi:hypothetical protein